MADQLQLRGGTTAEHATFTGALREVTVDTDKDTVVVHDNATVGGHPLAKENLSNVAAATAATKLDGQTIKFGGGSAATPSLTFNGDLNTGIYSPGADQIAVATGGTGRLFVDSSGRIGVGGSAGSFFPAAASASGSNCSIVASNFASVTSNAASLLYLDRNNADGRLIDYYLTGSAVGSTTITASAIEQRSVGSHIFYTGAATGGTERLRITSTGLVGVGTSSPQHKLAVVSSGVGYEIDQSSIANTNLLLSYDRAASAYRAVANYYGGTYSWNDGGTERMRIDSSGRLGVGTSSPVGTIHLQHPAQTNGYWEGSGLLIKDDATANSGLALYSRASNEHYIASLIDDPTSYLIIGTRKSSSANGVDALTIRGDGKVGVGTTSPSYTLDVNGQGRFTNDLLIADATATRGRIYGDSVGVTYRAESGLATRFMHVGTELARIDSSGRLLLGTSTSPTGGDAQYSKLVVKGYVGDNTGYAPIALMAGTNGASLANGSGIGRIEFCANDSASFAQITASVDGTTGSNDYPGRLVFSTTADGASSPTERMRIDNLGNVLIRTTGSASSIGDGMALAKYSGGSYLEIGHNTSAGNDGFIVFYRNGVNIGSITQNGTSNVTYSTSSDYRLKENIAPVTDGIARLQQLKPSRFNFILEPGRFVDGFIAHEVQEVVPEAIVGEKDAVNEDGSIKPQGIDQSKLVPLLTAALQEAVAKIESLEARLTAAGI